MGPDAYAVSGLPNVRFVPVLVEMLGYVFRFNLAPLFLPEAKQRRLVVTHDDPGIRAADEFTPARFFPRVGFHVFLWLLENRPPAPIPWLGYEPMLMI